MGPVRLKYIVFILLMTNHVSCVTSANNRILLAAGLAAGVLLASHYGYYTLSPEVIVLMTSVVMVTVIPAAAADQRTANQLASSANVASTENQGLAGDIFLATEMPSSCTTSGYTLHPVLGCIRYYTGTSKFTPQQWKAKCATDGGKLILINSEKENQELVKLIQQNGGTDSVIQGSRATSSDPWKTDAGDPLPYTADFLGPSNVSGTLNILASTTGKWSAVSPSFTFSTAVCEI